MNPDWLYMALPHAPKFRGWLIRAGRSTRACVALRGSIADYGLGDILQLLARGKRSGRLLLRGTPHRARGSGSGIELERAIRIFEGSVSEVEPTGLEQAELAARLTRAGLLSEAALGWALSERARTGRTIGSLLVEADLIDPGVFDFQEERFAWERILAPFTWVSGSYEFQQQAEEAGDRLYSIDQVLMRGLQLVDAWPEALRKVPSAQWIVVGRKPLPERPALLDPFATQEEAITHRPGSAPLSDEAEHMHELAEPGRTVAQVLDFAPLTAYEGTLALAELIEGGVLLLDSPSASSALR